MLGFSLFELLLTLFISMIIILIAIPSQKLLLDHAHHQVMSSQLLRAINLARSEAVMRGIPVMLCKSTDQKTCGGDWRDGYLIMAEEKVLFVFRNSNAGVLHWRGFRNPNSLQFMPSGLLYADNGTFWYCDEKNPVWGIVLNQAGRERLVYPDKTGRIIDDSGEVLTC